MIDGMGGIEDELFFKDEWNALQADYDNKKQARIDRYNEVSKIDGVMERSEAMREIAPLFEAEYAADAALRQYKIDYINDFIRPPAGGKKIDWSARPGDGSFAELVGNEDTWNHMFDEVEKMFHPRILDESPSIGVLFEAGERAHYKTGREIIRMGDRATHTLVHEYGHHIETTRPGFLEKMLEFLDQRRGSEDISEIYVGSGEKGWRDLFFSHYCGKNYTHHGDRYATEILTMGVERMYKEPLEFYNDDPEYFELIIRAMWDELDD